MPNQSGYPSPYAGMYAQPGNQRGSAASPEMTPGWPQMGRYGYVTEPTPGQVAWKNSVMEAHPWRQSMSQGMKGFNATPSLYSLHKMNNSLTNFGGFGGLGNRLGGSSIRPGVMGGRVGSLGSAGLSNLFMHSSPITPGTMHGRGRFGGGRPVGGLAAWQPRHPLSPHY